MFLGIFVEVSPVLLLIFCFGQLDKKPYVLLTHSISVEPTAVITETRGLLTVETMHADVQ